MPTYNLFRDKIDRLLDRAWRLKGGGEWNPSQEGFSHVTGPENRKGYKGKPAEGVHAETLRKWHRGDCMPDPTAIKRMLSFIDEFLESTPETLAVSDFTDEVSLAVFCRKLGFKNGEEVLATYRMQFIREGPQSDYMIKDKKYLREVSESLRGAYYAFRHDGLNPKNGLSITRLGIVILGHGPVSSRKNEAWHSIICRMSIPSIKQGRPYLYNGAVALRHALMSWKFLQEASTFTDVACMLTDKGDAGRHDVQRVGFLLTMSQKGAAAAASYKIVIRRVKEDIALGDAEAFLVEAAAFDVGDDDGSLGVLLQGN